jgi:hypothetical protein
MKAKIVLTSYDHPRLLALRGDSDLVDREINQLKQEHGGSLPLHEYVEVRQAHSTNTLTQGGTEWAMSAILGLTSNVGFALYAAPYSSDTSPVRSWDGDFGAASGGVVTEFTGYDLATRPVVTFPTPAVVGDEIRSAGATAGNAFVISSGQSAAIYGLVLTNNSTKEYDAGSAIAFAAFKYPSGEELSWQAGEAHHLEYTLVYPMLMAAA